MQILHMNPAICEPMFQMHVKIVKISFEVHELLDLIFVNIPNLTCKHCCVERLISIFLGVFDRSTK
jgi:hypothetical protein